VVRRSLKLLHIQRSVKHLAHTALYVQALAEIDQASAAWVLPVILVDRCCPVVLTSSVANPVLHSAVLAANAIRNRISQACVGSTQLLLHAKRAHLHCLCSPLPCFL
jgi:uncharacterized alpha-E superfamily protein